MLGSKEIQGMNQELTNELIRPTTHCTFGKTGVVTYCRLPAAGSVQEYVMLLRAMTYRDPQPAKKRPRRATIDENEL